MASSTSLIPVLLLALISSSCVSTSTQLWKRYPRGGWQPISNVNDPEIQELAKFAITEHNKLHGVGFRLGEVLGGEKQLVAGDNYKLILAARKGDGKYRKYEAVVWVKPWMNFKKLTSFYSV